jgi:hypothetical protein
MGDMKPLFWFFLKRKKPVSRQPNLNKSVYIPVSYPFPLPLSRQYYHKLEVKATHKNFSQEWFKEVKYMNLENIRELRTAHGEAEINELLSSGKWRVLNLVYEDEGIVATLAKVRA